MASRDTWLETFLGKPVWHFSGDESPDMSAINDGIAFADAKLDVTDLEAHRNYLDSGFHIVSSLLTFICAPEEIIRTVDEKDFIDIRFAIPSDNEAVKAIAKDAFVYDRFHVDPKISEYVAGEIKAAWAGNFFSGQRGEWMVVGEVDGKVVSFLQLLHGGDGQLIIDLIAVSEKARGCGLAKKMIAFASANCAPNSPILVGTQLANVPSVTLYENLGFRLISSNHVFHCHKAY